MNWKIKTTDKGIEVTVSLNARNLAREPLVGLEARHARQHLEESGYEPGECLNPGATAGNLDKTRLTATWFFNDSSKKTTQRKASTKKNTTKVKSITKKNQPATTNTSRKES